MEIKYIKGDATNPEGEGTKIIVHCCNNVGAWGAGFVLAISKKWYEPQQKYKELFKKNPKSVRLGNIQLVPVEKDIFVCNLIGQSGIKPVNGVPPIRYDAIREGLQKLYDYISKMKNVSVHMPRMGCGLAGGYWNQIEKIVQEELTSKGIPVTVYDL